MTELYRTLFFPDVPAGTFKPQPGERKGACSIGEAFSNLGADLHNALFFDDLATVQPVAPEGTKEEEKMDSGKNTRPLPEKRYAL